jgi:hypothetical protein
MVTCWGVLLGLDSQGERENVGSIQKTVLEQAGTINFSLLQPGFTQNSDHFLQDGVNA